MESTNLTIGGFSCQITRSLIEQSGSSEIGLAQRILWIFLKPSYYAKFSTLEAVEENFIDALGNTKSVVYYVHV